jgi:hypothetical protein
MSFMQMSSGGQIISFGPGGMMVNGKRVERAEAKGPETVKLVVDGAVVWEGKAKVAELHIEAAVVVDACSASVHVKGDCGSAKTVSGSIAVEGSVLGNASTVSGDIRAEGEIRGSARTVSGDIRSGGKKTHRLPK